MARVLCEGTGQPAKRFERGATDLAPHCPVCDRAFAASTRRTRARHAGAWQSIPRHFRSSKAEVAWVYRDGGWVAVEFPEVASRSGSPT